MAKRPTAVPQAETKRVLIWGKTCPELSEGHRETVCTGGCDERGKPVRLYPVPLRYLQTSDQYKLWQWIEVPVRRNLRDSRPESFRLADGSKIKLLDTVGTGSKQDWAARRDVIERDPSWRYECVRDLLDAQERDATSLGLIKVGAVHRVTVEERLPEERAAHEKKLARLKSRLDLFEPAQLHLDFVPFRIKVQWQCERLLGPGACPGHNMTVLDWGLTVLGRNKGADVAREKMAEICNLAEHDLYFFVGNMARYPRSFLILGMFYPKLKYLASSAGQTTIFST